MDIQKIQQYKSAFDLIEKNIKNYEGNTIGIWYARELQQCQHKGFQCKRTCRSFQKIANNDQQRI